MEKKLSDYLHFYLGCEVKTNGGFKDYDSRVGTFLGFADFMRLDCRLGFRGGGPEGRCSIGFLKPILRPLSSMTEEEIKEIAGIGMSADDIFESGKILSGMLMINYRFHGNERTKWIEFDKLSPEQFRYLLSKHFDLFNLIPEGLAIESPSNQ